MEQHKKSAELKRQIRELATEFGFSGFGVADCDLTQHEDAFQKWCEQGFYGEMEYMVRHGSKRSRPAELIPDTISILSFRMEYLPNGAADSWETMQNREKAFISRYALGRDYHKMMRQRLAKLAKKIGELIGPFGNRVFVDSAPVLERGIAERSGVGWIGKHTNLIEERSGSWFFLGEIYTDLSIEPDQAASNHCGSCSSCITACPTAAIISPYQLDARRCISYLTIELKGSIPVEFRKAIGNRIYGCDDCQLVCPWNRFAEPSSESDFKVRNGLDSPDLIELFEWSEEEFMKKLEGSPIRRIGHERWLRNISVALGNGRETPQAVTALKGRSNHESAVVREHIQWALSQYKVRSVVLHLSN
ncbi:MAG: tRNA epoxyqueuosine(34) reductase QueG [Thiotrichales bacterium]|jgi:epoxyqueuosine reductase|nr:tRNA epoxyqueuosine(34) reductase QueG [Thiotrichales bacterium]MBT3614037.1 tRNA epoxyqueuosine(34) reductase QueG [Thiotrichales bacterium]MBT3752394.1 tRNA epoxyqueuosine(34) reductase QueG [Thiotrichales bacterium]MBT3836922.1 tRNA epoxyqueuosine(34) reductase QueG [Thiotrichales bacterium]MBT4152467.1 tRNA epoxyqueuosine(34) reductase QueG [Thiotrichales bacterium]